MPASILIVEDDANLRAMIHTVLGASNYKVIEAGNIEKGLHLFQEHPVDLAILDLTLPDGSGIELCEKIRAHRTRFSTPVIILTADSKLESKVSGFSAGADHYLVKPFDINELALWVQSLLRRLRYNDEASGVITIESFMIDPAAHVVKAKDKEISNLTRKEFDLLYHLVSSRPKVLSKDYILSKLWNTVLTDNTVEVHIQHIRAKLGKDAAARIVTVSGKGYKFV